MIPEQRIVVMEKSLVDSREKAFWMAWRIETKTREASEWVVAFQEHGDGDMDQSTCSYCKEEQET